MLDQVQIQEMRRPNGRVIEVRSIPIAGGGAVRTFTDVTERKTTEDRHQYFAHHDDLTRLVNRVVLRERLDEALAMASSNRRCLALLYLDLDCFKLVNDTRGHGVGDRLLVEVAQRMRAAVRSVDTVARIGGDEFAIIIPFLDGAQPAEMLARRLISALGTPFVIDSEASTIGVSIGIALFPENADDAPTLIRHADGALYAAKRGGRNTFRFHDASMHALVRVEPEPAAL